MLVWQGTTCIAFIVTNEDEGITALVGAGLAIVVLCGVVKCVRAIYKALLSLTHKAFTIRHKDGDTCNSSYPVAHVRIRKRDINKYYLEGENDYFIKPSDWHPFNCDNIRKVRKNGWFCQRWVDKNVLKSRE